MNQDKKYEAPDVEVYSFSSKNVIMDCTGDFAGPCTTDNICVYDGDDCIMYGQCVMDEEDDCIMDGVGCILDGICPADGFCITDNTSMNG